MNQNQIFKRQPNESLSGEQLPRIDVTERVMNKIRHKAIRRNKSKPWLMASMAAVVILACGFGYAASSWKFFAPDGSVALEYRQFLPGDEPVERKDYDALKGLIAEGEAALFYMKEEDSYFSFVNEIQYDNYNEFALKVGYLGPAASIGDEFEFYTGTLGHLPMRSVTLMDELALEANHSDESIVYRSVPLGENIGYYAVYRNAEGDELSLRGMFGEQWRTVNSRLEGKEIEKVALGHREALYLKDKSSGAHRIVWMEGSGDDAVYLDLSETSDGALSRERLQGIAAQISGSIAKE